MQAFPWPKFEEAVLVEVLPDVQQVQRGTLGQLDVRVEVADVEQPLAS